MYIITMENWRDRAKNLMREQGIRQDDLADIIGKSRSNISHYLKGIRTPPMDIFDKIAFALGVTPEYLHYGSGLEKIPHAPIINWDDSLKWKKIKNNLPDNIERVVVDFYKKDCFALRVIGDSMMPYTMGYPAFSDGSIIIVDPEGKLESGKFIVAQLKGGDKIVFRKYIKDPMGEHLIALNPHYPPYVNAEFNLIGIVVASMILDL